MIVSDTDRELIIERYPGLAFSDAGSKILLNGQFAFRAAWDERSRVYIIDPDPIHEAGLIHIQDSYQVHIEVPVSGSPTVREVGGRLAAHATNLGTSVRDLHVSADGACCLEGVFDIQSFETLSEFLDGPTLQFFYDQSYFQRYGTWPRGQYLHGDLGLIESFYINRESNPDALTECIRRLFASKHPDKECLLVRGIITQKPRVQGHWPCLCNSNKPIRECHVNLFRGLWTLHEYVHNHPEVSKT